MSNASYEEMCVRLAAVVVHPLYRGCQMVHIVLCCVSFILLVHVLLFVWKQFAFHYNIKVLFICLYTACIIHSLWVATFQIHHLVLSLTFREPCDVILNPVVYGIFHVPLVWCVLWIEITMILMFIERTVATVQYDCYESTSHKNGNIFLSVSIIVPIVLNSLNYVGKDFHAPQTSALNTPSSNNLTTNGFFGFITIVNLGALIAASILYFVNTRKNISLQQMDLSAKYQASENAVAARFLTAISCGQLIIFFIYGAATIYLRMGVENDDEAAMDPYYRSFIMIAYTVPWYTMFLPIISLIGFRMMKSNRTRSISTMVQMKSVGEEGWHNYAANMGWN